MILPTLLNIIIAALQQPGCSEQLNWPKPMRNKQYGKTLNFLGRHSYCSLVATGCLAIPEDDAQETASRLLRILLWPKVV